MRTVNIECRVVVLVSSCIATWCGAAQPTAITKVFEMNLEHYLNESFPSLGPPVHVSTAISFSDDSEWIAVVIAGHRRNASTPAYHLMIINRADPIRNVRQVDLGGYQRRRITWSTDATSISIGISSPVIIDLETQRTCAIKLDRLVWHEDSAGFTRGALITARRRNSEINVRASLLEFYDKNCQLVDSWNIKGRIMSLDVADNLIAMMTERDGGMIVKASDKSVVYSWSWKSASTQVRFVDSGRAVCVGQVESRKEPPVCFATVGRRLDARPKLSSGWPFVTSSQSTLVVASDTKYSRKFGSEDDKIETKRIVVYDYRTGKEVASWKPSFQEAPVGGSEHKVGIPFVFTISSNGRYIAESGAGIVRLYELH